MKKRVVVLLSVVISFMFASDIISATPYYISPSGTASWSSCTDMNTPCSLSTANANAKAGDTVYLREGVYGEYIRPADSGTSDSNRITYMNYADENVTIYNTRYGIYIEDKSYISVKGIHFHHLEQFMFIIRSDHNIVNLCTFNHGRNIDQWTGSLIGDNSQYNKVQNCTFWDFGKTGPESGDNDGAMLDIGTIESATDSSFYNVVEGSHFYNCGHHCFGPWSKYAVFRDNYLHNEPWGPLGLGYRTSITHGLANGWNLFERNRFAFADGSAVGLRSTNNIFRHNMFYNNRDGALQIVGMSGGYTLPDNCLVYNNVFYRNGHGADYDPFSGGVFFADWGNVGPLQGNEFKNNIFYDNKGGAFTYDSDVPERISIIQNNYEGDPKFVSDMTTGYFPFGPKPDFSLQPDSPCIDTGGLLTNITSPTGSGTKFTVTNPWYFYDGWTIPGEVGDLIQVEGQATKIRILDVNYISKEITVESPISWTQNQGIGLAYEGPAPDIGAFEYPSGYVPVCGDGNCTMENCLSCPQDCGVCLCGNGVCDSSETCSSCSQDCRASNPADISPCDGCVSQDEFKAYLNTWKTSGQVTLMQLMEAIGVWKNAC